MDEMSIGSRSLICALALCVAVVSALPDCCLTACHEPSTPMDMSGPMAHHHHHQMSESATKIPVLAVQRTTCQHCRIAEPTFSFAGDSGRPFRSSRVAPLVMAFSQQSGTQTIIPDLSPPRSPGVLSASADLHLPLRI
jgi:hypothetical protein